MSLANVSVIGPSGQNQPASMVYRTEANATAILAGEPVKIGGTNLSYVIPTADNEPIISAPTFVGIAQSNSTQTAALDGTVQVLPVVPGLIYACKANSAAAFNTDAEILALLNNRVLFDLTAGVYTILQSQADNADNGIVIVGGDPTTSTVHFMIRLGCSVLA